MEIPKSGGGTRPLGIPTLTDRIAQMVAKLVLEPEVEPCFQPDSYGYRPKRSAIDAVGVARQRCWKYDWVVDMDIRAFFDSMDHDLLMRAVRKHTSSRWVLLYIDRWLKAPVQLQDGTVQQRDRGTPRGVVISPLLANLLLHYAFDRWMQHNHTDKPFERLAYHVCNCALQVAGRVKESHARNRPAFVGVWADPASRENKNRLLQGQELEGRLSGYQL